MASLSTISRVLLTPEQEIGTTFTGSRPSSEASASFVSEVETGVPRAPVGAGGGGGGGAGAGGGGGGGGGGADASARLLVAAAPARTTISFSSVIRPSCSARTR